MTKIKTYDVVVVGAGPSGLTTALSVARHGASVLVVERHSGTSIHPRAIGVTTRSMEVFRAWGVDTDIRAAEIGLENLQTRTWTMSDPHQPPFRFGYPTNTEALAVSPEVPAFIPQDSLEPLLLEHTRRLGVDVRFDTELTALRTEADGVSAELRDRVTGTVTHVEARFGVGGDGVRSTVRGELGVGMQHLGTLGEFSQVLFRADLDHVVGERRCFLYSIEHPEAAGLLLPVGSGRWTYVRKRIPDGDAPLSTTAARWTELIRMATGLPKLRLGIQSVLPFAMSADVAASFRVGCGFLVGDAAHRMTPLGGVGMNTGIHDAHNLGWKLAWAVRGWAGEALLASYDEERRPIGLRNALKSLNTGALDPADEFDAPGGLAADLGVTYRSAVVADAGAEPAPGFGPSGRPGERAPHRWVQLSGRRLSTLDLFDGRLTLLTGRSGGAWHRAAAGHHGAPLTVLTFGHELTDPDQNLARAFGVEPADAVLVRPDGHVAWRSALPPDNPNNALADAIDSALGATRADAMLAS